MSELIKGFNTKEGVKKIDYLSLANLPTPFDGLWVSPSEGLEYTLSDDGTYYICSDIGSCIDYVLYVPETYKGKPVKSIRNCRAERIIIPSSFEEIPYLAFDCDQDNEEQSMVSCKVLGNNLKSIGMGAFRGNYKLRKVDLPDSVTDIGRDAFAESYLDRFEFPSNLQSIGERAFYRSCLYGVNGGTINIPDSVKTIGARAFCSLSGMGETDIVIGSGVTSIETGAFSYSGRFKKVTMKCKSPTIATDAFENCEVLLVINVAWSQGAVAGAPWGATNATINYNYKGE